VSVFYLKELTVVGERVPFPGFQDNFQGFLETASTLLVGNTINVVGAGKGAAANAKVKTALGDLTALQFHRTAMSFA
jgi:hypothetical protein